MSTTKRSRSGSRKSKRSLASNYKTLGQIAIVEWEDAWAGSRWGDQEDKDPGSYVPYIVHTVGVVLWHNEKGIQMSASMTDTGRPGSLFFVPAGMIRNITVIKDD